MNGSAPNCNLLTDHEALTKNCTPNFWMAGQESATRKKTSSRIRAGTTSAAARQTAWKMRSPRRGPVVLTAVRRTPEVLVWTVRDDGSGETAIRSFLGGRYSFGNDS